MIKLAKASLGTEEIEGVVEVFETIGWLGMGSKVFEFEEALKDFLGVHNVVAVNTGTSALHIALDALGIGPGDEVIIPSLTYVASFQAVSATGATPIACDIDPDTLLIDLDDMCQRITRRTKAIMPVHYVGNPCDMGTLLEIKEKTGIRIVEDAAHAFGSLYKGHKIGSFGDITCFSFDSIKNITCGEGGAVIAQDDALAEVIRQKRLLGVDRESPFRHANERKWLYDVTMQGFRYHMSNINAAIGLAQLKKLPGFIKKKRHICQRYDQAFTHITGIETLNVDYSEIAPFMYIIEVQNGKRYALMQHLKSLDIESGVHYLPNHKHVYFQKEHVELPNTDRVAEKILTLPLHAVMTAEDVATVIAGVQSFFKDEIGE